MKISGKRTVSYFFNNLRLRTKLLLMMLFLSLLSIGLLFFVYSRAEKRLITEMERYTDDLSAAIQVSMEQLTKGDEEIKDEQLKEYVKRFNKKGIRDISILDNDKEVIASSNPKYIGRVLDIKGEIVKAIGGGGEYLKTMEGHRNYDIILPVVVGSEQLGYVHIAIILDDFTELLRANNLKRLIATIVVFALGIIASLFLSMKYTQPIRSLVKAARRVTEGDLTETMEVRGRDEIGELTMSFNEMVNGLREMRKMEERLRRAEHLSQLGQLASGIAHEVRNPLNLISLSIDHLRARHAPSDPKDRDEFNNILSYIKNDIYRLNRLISNFLDYGKPLKMHLQPARINDIIEDVISLAGEKLIEQHIKVERRVSGMMPSQLIDTEQIKACILNVVLNSIQAMPQGGQLIIETSTDDCFASLKVMDTGTGISPKHIPHIFEPYFTTKDTGIGLGLAITKRIIEEHGGTIDIMNLQSNDISTATVIKLPL